MIAIIGTILFFVLAGLILWVFTELIWGDRAIEAPQPGIALEHLDDPISKELQIVQLAQSQWVSRVAIDPKNFSL